MPRNSDVPGDWVALQQDEIAFGSGLNLLRIVPTEFDSSTLLAYRGVNADVTIRAGHFSGQLEVAFYVGDFQEFERQLASFYRSLEGTAVLLSSDYPLKVRFSGNGRGAVTITGEVGENGGPSLLCVSSVVDQTYLPSILSSVRRLIEVCI